MLNRKDTKNTLFDDDDAMKELKDTVDGYANMTRSAESALSSYRSNPHRGLVFNCSKENLASKLMERRLERTLALLIEAKETLA